MEVAVVGAVVGATIQVVIQNLISLSMKEIKLVRDFKKDLEKLKSSLIMIQDILNHAEMQEITDKAVKQWLKKLEDVAFEADNVLDVFDYQFLRKNSTKTTVKKKIKSIFSGSNFRDHRLKLGHKIRTINKELELINGEASSFGLQMRLVGVHAPGVGSDASASSETDSFSVDPVFIGRDDDVSTLVEMLTKIPTEQVFSILPIVGMGGLGKTTLARKVYHDEKIRTHFQIRIWVHVSTDFDPIILLKKILTTLTPEKVEVDNREALLKKLQEALGAKTYLLVLDDVWNHDRLKWEGFINSLSGITSSSIKGNGVVVTMRNREVASIVGTLPIYELKGLAEDICWSIIKAKAFGAGDIPSEFETIGRNIAKRCQGLPLAANVVGGVLRGKSRDEWLSIQENWLSDVGGDVISKILRLSFDHLSSPSLKKCFAYCSIYPRGARIERKELIEVWMAEGFLQPDQRSDMETVGNKFLILLLQNSLLQVVQRDDYGNVMYCSMHDLVHDVASSVLGFSKVNDNISDDIYHARYISYECIGDESSRIPKEKAKYLRTLILLEGGVCDAMFSDFKSLHVLTLMDYHVKELPSSIRELIHLRYLNISNTRIKCLPDWIGELYHLQTLRAHKHSLRKLPNTFKYLISLRHLYIDDIIELPAELGMLTSLQTLPYFKVGNEEGHRIIELGSLKNLKGELKIHNLEKVHGEEEAKKAYLYLKPNIVSLVLRWKESREGEINDTSVLEGLQPHPNLKILEIFGFKGTSFPLWTLKMAELNNLMEIRLKNCSECEEIPMLGHLPHLKSLYLSHLRNVKFIGSSFYGIDNCISKKTIIVYPVLKLLDLSNMPNLTEWEEVESETQPRQVKVFPCLEYLNIHNCKQLRSAPSQFPCLERLNINKMESGLPLASICGIKLTSLTELIIDGLNGLICLPDELFYNNQNLSELRIISCPNLRELPDGLHTLYSLKVLTIAGCPNLKSIPYSSGGKSQSLTLLRSLLISDCEGLLYLPCEMVESCAPSLQLLRLQSLSSLMNLPMIIERLHKMPRLKELAIVNVRKLITATSIEMSTFCSLQDLTISPTSDSSDSVSFNKAVDGILLQGSESLRRLELSGMEDWDSLPDELQHLSALSELYLHNFGIEEFPEWFGNLSSLKTLYLSDCKKLRCLPSVEAMRRLTKLTFLTIEDCPVLKQRSIEQQSDDGSEWPKIAHIPFILVDGRPIRFYGRSWDY